MSIINFAHLNSPTVPLAVTAASARVALPQTETGMLVISNTGASPAFCSAGDANITAAASTGNGMCVPNGQTLSFRIGPRDTHVAAICAGAGTATLSISVVNGGVKS